MDSSSATLPRFNLASARFHPAANGNFRLILALTDLDGTANDEQVPEHARLATIAPAREAFAQLARAGIATGICTARSFGEAAHYREALRISGPLIAENGAVRERADGTRELLGDPAGLAQAVERIAAAVGRRLPHSLDWKSLEAAWDDERHPGAAVHLGHPDRDSLRRAADRLASCFLVGLTPAEKAVAKRIADELGFDAFGELLHLIPHGANKGAALAKLLAELRESGVPREPLEVIPVVFGNGENDLALFRQALAAHGVAVLVGDASSPNGFHFDPAQHPVPAGTLCFPGKSHGHAIQASLPQLAERLRELHGLRLEW